MTSDINNLIWIDLEMTGLDTQNDEIIEIATIVTDSSLKIIAEGPMLAIHQEDAILDGMDEWNTRQHTGSGLVKRVKESTVTMADAEQQTIEFCNNLCRNESRRCAGNSICQDRRFLARQMPLLEAYFHYRNLDVSSVKEMVQRWSPELLSGFSKESKHLALDDIRDSIDELTYYRGCAFKI